MEPFTRLEGRMAPLPAANIDTDQILPGQFLKTIDRKGLGRALFHGLRYDEAGRPRPDFVLNRPEYAGASILVTGDNFGCGSSREHAPWALLDFGIRCVISTSFADIFYNNCFQNGLLPVVLGSDAVAALMNDARSGARPATIDLEGEVVIAPSARRFRFEIDASRKARMLRGLDPIGETLQLGPEIAAYERRREAASRVSA